MNARFPAVHLLVGLLAVCAPAAHGDEASKPDEAQLRAATVKSLR